MQIDPIDSDTENECVVRYWMQNNNEDSCDNDSCAVYGYCHCNEDSDEKNSEI